MVKVIPRIRLRVKTPAKATPRRLAKQKPRFRREATLNPPPDLTVSRVLLPQVPPCDIILEHKKFHLTKVELDKIFPHDVRACPLKLGAHKAEVRLPGASAAVTTAQGSDLAVVNVGCYVSCVSWSPCGLVLAVAVNGREKPAIAAEGLVEGLSSIQLWRVDLGKSPAAQLRVGLVHEGAGARSLQWLPSKRGQERLGLLLAALGSGETCIYSLPKNVFEEKALSRALLFARFTPAWIASSGPPGAEPKAVWERYLQCAAARADARDLHGATVAAGCEKAVVLVWRLRGKGTLETSPCAVLRPNLQDADTVVSLAWAPTEEELLVAGLASGFLVLWDLAVPVVPLRAFMPGSRMPMLNLSWNDASTVCVPSECVLIDMRDERMSQFRPHRGSSGKHLVRCTDMCHCPAGVLSVWSDGAVHLKPRERLNFGKEMRSTKSGREAQKDDFWQCWAFSGNPDLRHAPFPHMAYECPKEEPERKEYIGKMFLEYEYELLNHLRLWETSSKHTLELVTAPKEEQAMPLTCVALAIPKSDGSSMLATGSSGGIVSIMLRKKAA